MIEMEMGLEKNPVFFFKYGVTWQKTSKEYFKTILATVSPPQAIKFEMIDLPRGYSMYPHYHSQKDEILFPVKGSGTITAGTLIERFDQQSMLGAFVPRGFVHEIKPDLDGITYLVAAFTDGDISISSIDTTSAKYQYAIYPVKNQRGQELALGPMSYIKRWQHEGKSSDQEQYIRGAIESGSDVKIIVFYNGGEVVGSALVGRSEGYDLEKTRAMISYGKGDPNIVNENDVWINYQSWECLPNESPYSFNVEGEGLKSIWEIFTIATKEAFPEAKGVAVRSRHSRIWAYVYTAPWKLISKIDLRGFEWDDPAGNHFGNYDERFSEYGILRLPLG